MNVLVILACVAMVAARPEPPVGGYHYQQHGGGHGHAGGHGGGHAGGHAGYSYQQPAFGSINQFSGTAATASAGSAATAFDSLALGGVSSSFSGAAANTQSFGGSFAGANANAQSSAFAAAPTQQIVQKHIYVHVPPPEPELSFQQTISAPALRQKHYKIIFIKTPSVPSQAAQLALAQSQTEEKTIVYVLVKKPEQLGDITLPSPAIAKPSKPEVYFIKYKTNSEGGNAAAFANAGASAVAGAGAAAGGLGLLSSSGVASSSASAGASSGHAHSPANTYGAPGGGSHGGYH
ncbi:uncharacterized protein LOC126579779 [Anopheles aquasalis]|uniref:uncharacterized protein LOC126579779 n=1 Tax=Anopheles aquasalis TaxID=42839 RepID=UPI00215A2206|nr:uncharacterized protein LOC126579779 [Anopheles aquasalis]